MISFEDGHKVCYDTCDLCCHSDLLFKLFFFQIKSFCNFFFSMKVKESLSSSPSLLFLVAFLSFFQLENKKSEQRNWQ